MSESADDPRSALIHKRLEAESLEEENLEQQQEEASVNFLWRLWYRLRGYALDDIARLREAGISSVEAKADEQHVQNKKTDAEAEKAYMEAEMLKQKAAKQEMEKRKEELNLEEKRQKLEKERLRIEREKAEAAERQAEALERIKDAIRTIKAKGGDVFFDSEQIEEELSRLDSLPETAPDDPEE